MKHIWIGLGLAGVLTFAGCGGSQPEKKAETPAASTASGPALAPDLANGATITGKVILDGPKPVMKPLDMSANPVCMRAHASSPQLSEEVVVNPNGTLKYAFVWIKDGAGVTDKRWQVPAAAVSIDQAGCMYQPHMIGVMAGQKIDIKNSDPTNHNIHPMPVTNQEWNESQPPGGQDIIQSFPRQEVMIPLHCNIHPWMKAYVGVVAHPFFAVTGDDGTYTIKGVPAGTYTLEVWQERYKTIDVPVTVAPKDTKTVDLTFKS
jgi:plastocyanin